MLVLTAWSCRGEEGDVLGKALCSPPRLELTAVLYWLERDVVGEINLLVSKSIAVSTSEGTEAPGDQSSLN